MSEAVFAEREEGVFVPSGHARGPWDPQAMHGGAPAALLVRAVERLEAPGPMLLSRITIEFLAPVPLEPVRVAAEIVRPGKRLQLAEATLLGEDGTPILRARAVRTRREAVEIPEAALPVPRLPRPEDVEPMTMEFPLHDEHDGFGSTAMQLRFVEGVFNDPGPAIAWFRLARPLVEGEEPTPAQRAIAAADFGNGIGAELLFQTHVFVNTELTMHLAREPVGEWIAVEARTEHGPEGTAAAFSTLHDERGPVGRGAQALYVAGR
jgi:hypothetical protein